MSVERKKPEDPIEAFIEGYYQRRLGRIAVETGKYREQLFWSSPVQKGKRVRALRSFLKSGVENTPENRYGFSIVTEIITFRIIDKTVFSFTLHREEGFYHTYLVPLSLDRSSRNGTGIDTIITKETKLWHDGRYVQEPILGIDVTRAVNPDTLEEKRKRLPLRNQISMPVIVLPVGDLPQFKESVYAFRREIVNGNYVASFDFQVAGVGKELFDTYCRLVSGKMVEELRKVRGFVDQNRNEVSRDGTEAGKIGIVGMQS